MAEYHHSNRNRHNSDSDGNSIVPVHTAGTAATAKTASDGSLPSGPTLGPSDTLEPLNPFDTGVQMHNGKRVLGEEDAYNQLAHAWPLRKKWLLLTVVAVCQTSKWNFSCTTLYLALVLVKVKASMLLRICSRARDNHQHHGWPKYSHSCKECIMLMAAFA
jgi:hypothetical protein